MGLPEDVLHFFERFGEHVDLPTGVVEAHRRPRRGRHAEPLHQRLRAVVADADGDALAVDDGADVVRMDAVRSEEHTSELQSLMRISYAVFCLKKKTTNK